MMTPSASEAALRGSRFIGFFSRWSLALGFLVVQALLTALYLTNSLANMELAVRDFQFHGLSRLEAQPVPQSTTVQEVVVVGIDDASLKEFNVPVAVLHRQIGAFFEAMASARARAVGIDVVLPERSYDHVQPGLDAALAQGILRLRPVAPLVIAQTAGADGRLRRIHPLFANLVGPEGTGVVLVMRDADGLVRRFDERIGVDGQAIVSLPGRLARRLDAPVSAGIVPMYRGQPMPYTPLRDVLALQSRAESGPLQQLFAGKVVLLGSLLDFDDLHPVPVSLGLGDAGGMTHGVFILARQLRALLGGDLIREAPAFASLLMALFGACTWWLRPSKSACAVVVLALVGVGVASVELLMAGWATPTASLGLAMVAGLGGRIGLASWQSAAERRRLRLAFGGLVSPGVLDEILTGRLAPDLAGERRNVCLLFSDIRDFTTLSEHLPPQQVTELLNRYFERMVACVHRHGGTVDKFMGDGIMAFFGAPRDLANPCQDAFGAATDMLRELDELNQEQAAQNGARLSIGVGLHYGEAFLGYIGSKDRHEYSAIGDTVNATARLEGLSKGSGYPVIVSATVRALLPEVEDFVDLGKRAVKGRSDIDIFGWKQAT